MVLSLFFGRSAGQDGAARRIVAGQYLGFTALLAVTVAFAFGATFLPKPALAYLGFLPLQVATVTFAMAGTTSPSTCRSLPGQASPGSRSA